MDGTNSFDRDQIFNKTGNRLGPVLGTMTTTGTGNRDLDLNQEPDHDHNQYQGLDTVTKVLQLVAE